MNTDDAIFESMDSDDLWFGGSGETNGKERNPISPPLPYKPCGAKKRDGEPCRGAAMPNGRCRLHGGLTPSGTASPHYKHGRRSKLYLSLPETIRQALDTEEDAGLAAIRKDMRTQVGLFDEALEELGQAYQDKNKKEINKIQYNLRKLIMERARVVLQEHRRQMDLKAMLGVKDLVVMLTTILETVQQVVHSEVEDREVCNRIIAGVARHIHGLLTRRSVPAPTNGAPG